MRLIINTLICHQAIEKTWQDDIGKDVVVAETGTLQVCITSAVSVAAAADAASLAASSMTIDLFFFFSFFWYGKYNLHNDVPP